MKNVKKIGIALLIVAIMVTTVLFASVAADDVEYTGTVSEFNALVDAAAAAGTTADKEVALDAVVKYLAASPVDPGEAGYDGVYEKYEAQMIAIASLYVDESKAAGALADKGGKMTLADKWAAIAFPTDEDKATDAAVELYAKIHSQNLAVAQLYYGAIEIDKIDTPNVKGVGNTDAAVAATQVKQMKSYVADHTFNESDSAYVAFMESYNAVVAKADAAMEARYQALIFQAKLDEYGLGKATSFNFEAGSGVPSVANNSEGIGPDGRPGKNFVGKESETVGYDEKGNALLNTYYTLRWTGATSTSGGTINSYFNLSYGAASSGMVIEFDLTTFDKLPNKGIGFQPYSGSSWMNINASGDFFGYGAGGSGDAVGTVKGAIVKGEWSRITYVYNPDDRAHCELYLDYVFLGYVHGDYAKKGTVASALRMGNTSSTSGSFSIDNVTCMRGTAIRDEEYLRSKSEPELVIFYDEYIRNSDIAVSDRVSAYDSFGKIVGNYVQINLDTGEPMRNDDGTLVYRPFPAGIVVSEADLKAALNNYYVYDMGTIIEEYSKDNLLLLRGMVDELAAYVPAPTATSLNQRNAKLDEIENFITLNGEYIYDDSAALIDGGNYNYCMTVVGDVTTRVETDTLIYDFINAMTAFRNASSVAMLTSKYGIAEGIIAGGVDLDLRYEVGYEAFLDLYENEYLFATDKIDRYMKLANAKKYVDSVNYIFGVYPTAADWKRYPVVRAGSDWTADDINEANAKYGTSVVAPALEWSDAVIASLNESLEYDLLVGWTDEKIAANKAAYDYLFNYAIMIRSYVKQGINEDYPGYITASAKAQELLDHYYGALQADHARAIREQLDKFAHSTAFIEKQGILSYIDRYIDENDIDFTNPEIAELLATIEAYKNELPPQEGDYDELLAQNTVYFINLSKQFGSAITYAEKRELYDRATPYYYAMNVGSKDAQAAVALYDALTAELKVVEDASKGLIEAVMLLPTALDSDTYFGYLVDAALCYELADASIEGVTDAMKAYTAARDAYNLKVNTENAQLIECGDALGSLRANCGLSAIISVIIAKLYSF